MIEDDDARWVRQTLEGNSKAFEALVQKYHKPIFNIAFRMIQDRDEAEDITQSVFVKAYVKLNTFNFHFRFFSWLYRMAVNESLNFLKERKRFSELDERYVASEKGPDESVQDDQQAELVQRAVMELAVDARIVIVLKHFMELSYQEMSWILDIPEKTVKSRLFTARQNLKEIIVRKGMIAHG
jgi:RNA polymerase sigma-70 factor (ECF subfamily)